ncbi:uncharacterized protein TNIN_469721 [Trichonephila inaurata madagascariensis]|uniref:Uncharacterized protein n=1 Tax=Trichonephila inaurata madagascariensis TaxID=2747483 RepID=A0A8X6XGL8_9ARAC|nr:uncharacterized protein TNIN_469721 [Trichonephila inaurata madagascariensis]
MRGAANLGGNFNYKLQFTFTPSPNMCLKGSHGHDPMSINFETYYQLWNKLTDDWEEDSNVEPGFLSWNYTGNDGAAMGFNDTSGLKQFKILRNNSGRNLNKCLKTARFDSASHEIYLRTPFTYKHIKPKEIAGMLD